MRIMATVVLIFNRKIWVLKSGYAYVSVRSPEYASLVCTHVNICGLRCARMSGCPRWEICCHLMPGEPHVEEYRTRPHCRIRQMEGTGGCPKDCRGWMIFLGTTETKQPDLTAPPLLTQGYPMPPWLGI